MRGVTIADLVFNLPVGSSDAYFEDYGSSGDGFSQLRSNNNTFEVTSFANPTNSLTVNRGSSGDSITVSSIPDFTRSLTIGSFGSPFSAVNFAGAVTLTGSSTLSAYSSGDITLASAVKTDTGAITLTATGAITQSAGTVEVAGTLTVTSGQPATFISTGNKASSLVIPSGVVCLVNGSFDASGAVQVDGTLGGSGSVGTVSVMAGGKVTPGTSPGKLSTGNIVFNSTSTVTFELNGGTAGSSYDQIVVIGTVDLGGATLNASLGFTPTSLQKFRIVDNDGTDTVGTTFNGYAEGATVVIGGKNFTINYNAGDGNDVELTAPFVAPPPPTVGSITFGDGSNQRSMVTQMIIPFNNGPVTFTGDVTAAITLTRNGTNSSQPGGSGTVAFTSSPANGSTSAVTITFTPSTTFVHPSGSLFDGFYDLKIDANQVSNPGGKLDGGSGAGTDYNVTGTTANMYFRLFGDSDGSGQVDFLTDFIAFRNAFANGGPNSIFDFDNSNTVDFLVDFINFRNRFNATP